MGTDLGKNIIIYYTLLHIYESHSTGYPDRYKRDIPITEVSRYEKYYDLKIIVYLVLKYRSKNGDERTQMTDNMLFYISNCKLITCIGRMMASDIVRADLIIIVYYGIKFDRYYTNVYLI